MPAFGVAVTQRQGAESALYAFAFLVALPAAVLAAPRLARAVSRGPHANALGPAVALILVALMGAMALVRAGGQAGVGGGSVSVLVVMGVWWLGAAALAGRLTGPAPWAPAVALARHGPWAWALAGVAVVLGTALVIHPHSLSPAGLMLATGLAAAAVALAGRVPVVSRRAAIGLETAALMALVLAIPDLVVITPEDPSATTGQQILDAVIQFHADFLLGPANQVLGGGPMLVDTSSQYGVGSIYSLVAWFELLPIGYGTLSLYDGVATAACFLAGYAIVRMAGVSRPMAVGTFAAAVVLLVVFNREYPVGALLQEGPLRFGMPMLLVLAAVAGARFEQWRRRAGVVAVAVLGLSSIWAAEAFVYTAITYAAIVTLEAWLAPPGRRLRLLARGVGLGLAACLVAHVLFAVLTLIGAGQLPGVEPVPVADQGLPARPARRDHLRLLALVSRAGVVGAALLAEGTALLLLVLLRPELARERRAAFVALTGLTVYGVLIYSYFVNRSADHVLPYVTTPALLAGAVWLSLVTRPGGAPARAALAFALALLLVPAGIAWSSVRRGFDNSALGHLMPGGTSTGDALDRDDATSLRSISGPRRVNGCWRATSRARQRCP